jgi:hypothetical protein
MDGGDLVVVEEIEKLHRSILAGHRPAFTIGVRARVHILLS